MNIAALLTGTEKITELFRKLLTIKSEKRRERFEKVFEPLFDAFLKIHSDYVSIFNLLIREMSDVSSGDPAKMENCLIKLRADFETKRWGLHAERLEIRHLADQLICSSQNEEEAIFLWTLICYFLQNVKTPQPPELLSFWVGLLKREESNKVLDTPSSTMLGFLSGEDDPQKIMKFAKFQIETVCGHLSDASKAYAKLKELAYK